MVPNLVVRFCFFLSSNYSKGIDNLVTHTPTLPPAAAKITNKIFINEQDSTAVALKPSHRWRPSSTKLDIEGLSITVESGLKTGSDVAKVANFQTRLLSDAAARDSKEFQKASFPSDEFVDSNKELKSVKYVNKGNDASSYAEFLHTTRDFATAEVLYENVIKGIPENKDYSDPYNLIAGNMVWKDILLTATCALRTT